MKKGISLSMLAISLATVSIVGISCKRKNAEAAAAAGTTWAAGRDRTAGAAAAAGAAGRYGAVAAAELACLFDKR